MAGRCAARAAGKGRRAGPAKPGLSREAGFPAKRLLPAARNKNQANGSVVAAG
jgi:hypothetical protein